MTIAMLNKIGSTRLSYVGALLQKWENTADEGVSFTEWVLDSGFIEATKRHTKMVADSINYLTRELVKTKEELSESQKDITRLVSVNKDLYNRIEQQNPTKYSIDNIRNILIAFNKENPVAVSGGGGVTFDGHVKINNIDSLGSFLTTVHARKLGVPSNIVGLFKVFVLDGKLVTLSDDYHGGVGYSFLWKKKKTSVKGAVGWSSVQAKRYDPRLGIDPTTGVNFIDPETGKMWIHPVFARQSSEPKKRAMSETSDSSPTKKSKSEGCMSVSGSENKSGVKEEEEKGKVLDVKNEEDEEGATEEGELSM